MKKINSNLKRKSSVGANQLILGALLIFTAVVGTITITKSQYLGSDASSGKLTMGEKTEGPIQPQYGYLWPNAAGAFLESNEPWPWMTYLSISKNVRRLKFTQVSTNPNFSVAYYGKFTEPVLYTNGTHQVGEQQTTGQIYGWTKDSCDTSHRFFFHPIFQLPDGTWIVSGNELITFDAMSSPGMHCAPDKNREGWNAFWGEGVYNGNKNEEIVAGALSFAQYNWGAEPRDWEIAKVTLNNPVQPWP